MDYSYDLHGGLYASRRRSDPTIAIQLQMALGTARSVLNVGAGTGSYEHCAPYVVALEPSATMRAQRPAERPAIAGSAENLPFDTGSFDACMTILSLHHWTNKKAGLLEMKRVSRQRIVVLTYDPDELERFWLFNYVPELAEVERRRFMSLKEMEQIVQMPIRAQQVSIPFDCQDAFNEAFYGRPEKFLDPTVRACQSAWQLLGPDVEQRFVQRLNQDLQSGEWDRLFGKLRTQVSFEGAIRLWIAEHP